MRHNEDNNEDDNMRDDQPDRSPTLCDNCGCGITRDEHGMLHGCLQISVRGGYGWFTDDLDFAPVGFCGSAYEPGFLFCHDCAAMMWRMFPVFSRLYGTRGQHPFRGDAPCCEWGWQGVHDSEGALVSVRYGDGSAVYYTDTSFIESMIEQQHPATWPSASSEAVPLTLDVLQRERERVRKLIDEDTSGG